MVFLDKRFFQARLWFAEKGFFKKSERKTENFHACATRVCDSFVNVLKKAY